MLSLAQRIIAHEEGELDGEETIELFQELIDTGLAWQLQGHYGRVAVRLIEDGVCRMPGAAAPERLG